MSWNMLLLVFQLVIGCGFSTDRRKKCVVVFLVVFQLRGAERAIVALWMFWPLQEKVDELQMELDSTKLDLEHAQLSAKENEAAARALRYAGICNVWV